MNAVNAGSADNERECEKRPGYQFSALTAIPALTAFHWP